MFEDELDLPVLAPWNTSGIVYDGTQFLQDSLVCEIVWLKTRPFAVMEPPAKKAQWAQWRNFANSSGLRFEQ